MHVKYEVHNLKAPYSVFDPRSHLSTFPIFLKRKANTWNFASVICSFLKYIHISGTTWWIYCLVDLGVELYKIRSRYHIICKIFELFFSLNIVFLPLIHVFCWIHFHCLNHSIVCKHYNSLTLSKLIFVLFLLKNYFAIIKNTSKYIFVYWFIYNNVSMSYL